VNLRWLCLLDVLRIACAGDVDPHALLARVRAKAAEDSTRIPRYVCRQRIQRQVFEDPKKISGCAGILAEPAAKLRLASQDQAKLDVMLADDHEFFSWPGRHRFDVKSQAELLVGGTAGSGDFASFRMDILGLDSVSMDYAGSCGDACARFRYSVPHGASGYVLRNSAGTFTVAYHGTFDVDPRSAGMLRLSVIAGEFPVVQPEVCAIRTQIDYASSSSGAGNFTIPSITQKSLVLGDGSHFETRVAYEQCREFSSESVVTFAEDPATSTPSARPAPPGPAPLSEFEVQLVSTIYSEKSFAGEALEAALMRPIHDSTSREIPAGTIVRGHLAQIERVFAPRKAIVIAIRFDAMVLSGVEVPLALEPEGRSDARGHGVFVFPGSRIVLDKKFTSWWRVIAP